MVQKIKIFNQASSNGVSWGEGIPLSSWILKNNLWGTGRGVISWNYFFGVFIEKKLHICPSLDT